MLVLCSFLYVNVLMSILKYVAEKGKSVNEVNNNNKLYITTCVGEDEGHNNIKAGAEGVVSKIFKTTTTTRKHQK